MKYDVAVIGGGLSGLAASVELASRRVKVILIEQAPELGGRCYSFIDPVTKDIVDNGQHILVEAYHHTLKYLDRIGTRKYLSRNTTSSITFHHPEKGICEFSTKRIPPGSDIPAGIFTSPLLTAMDRLKIIPLGKELQSWNASPEAKLASMTIEDWLNGLNQSENIKKCFWYPIAISAMNELPNRASALLFARVLKQAFFGAASDADFLIPTVGQSELYVHPARDFLTLNKAEILFGTEVTSLDMKNKLVNRILLKNGQFIEAEKIVCAIPYYALARILSDELLLAEPFNALSRFQSSPIVSINLWFDRMIMEQVYLGVIGKRVQWLFNRNAIIGKLQSSGSYLSAVISAAYEVVEMSKEELVQMAMEDIAKILPDASQAKLVHSTVVKEKRATFSCTPNIERYRPNTQTPVRNLFLAGDWTNMGLPGTIEGAVMSGIKAAEAAIR
ncbi:MAG: hydroxysqualene dehydroxylase HpnE [Bacteroidota bacterium]